MKTSRVVWGVLAGAAVGALVGVLFAPRKGSKTRKKIVEKGEAITENLKDRLSHLKEEASDIVEKFNDVIHSSKPEVKTKAENNRMKVTEVER